MAAGSSGSRVAPRAGHVQLGVAREQGAGMQELWVRVSAEAAERHPLYGLGGWLRIVSVLMALTVIAGPLLTVVFTSKVLSLPAETQPAGLVMAALLALGTATALVMAVLWFRRAPHFLRAYVELSALSIALDFFAELLLRQWGPLPPPFARPPGNLFAELVLSVLISGIPYWLLWRSRRFRVTFQHELRNDDPMLSRGFR
jgi:hypothetical protein